MTKTEKVIVSLIVDREDDPENRAKAEAVNAMIKLEYMNNPKVLVCNHDNLRERKYRQRRDNFHLTVPGTSRLANNLKYKIAEALDIQVVKKRRSYDRYNSERYDDNANQRSWDHFSNNNNKNLDYTNNQRSQNYHQNGLFR